MYFYEKNLILKTSIYRPDQLGAKTLSGGRAPWPGQRYGPDQRLNNLTARTH